MCIGEDELAPFLARVPEIRASPAFPAAFDRYCSGMLRSYQRAPILNKLINEQGRFLISALAFQLHLDRDPEDPGSGLTVARLVTLCAEHGVASSGRVKAFVALMRLGGFLAPHAAPSDRRSRVLVPTERMLAYVRVFTAVQMRCLDPLFDRRYLDRLGEDTGFLDRFHRIAGGYFLRGARLQEAFPTLSAFTEADAGYSILLSMIRQLPAPEGRPMPAKIDVPYGAVAKRFGVSRVHVGNLLRGAAAAGFVDLSGSGGHGVVVAASLIDLTERWFAAQMALMDAAAADAAAGYGAPGGPLRPPS